MRAPFVLLKREHFGKRLHYSPYSKKKMFATVRYVTLRYVTYG